VCTGNVPNSDFLKNSFSDKLNPFGYIQVNEHLQMAGYRNIFVAGDITDVPQEEEKLCQTAGAETSVVIKNLINTEKRQPLHVYDADKFPMVVSLGKYDGIFFWYGWTLTGFIPAVMKEFVEWKELIWYWDWSRFKGESHYMDFAHHSSGALDV
jgi:NADH dehydrogenase FAD-containing subunit